MTREEVHAIVDKHFDELQSLNNLESIYEYEKNFGKIWKEVGRNVLKKILVIRPTINGKKTFLTTFGDVSLNIKNPFSHSKNGFQISALLQEKIVYLGQFDCYANGSKLHEEFYNINVYPTQIYRVTDYYASELGMDEKLLEWTMPLLAPDEILYTEVDGSMVLTRTDEWKEAKLERIFKSGDCIDLNGKLSWIRHSQYFAQMGGCEKFTDKMDAILDSYGAWTIDWYLSQTVQFG